MTDLRNISDESLWSQTYELASQERATGLKMIHHLREINHRRLHLKRGYNSLFTYAVQFLKYSEGSAARRIAAMKLIEAVPEIEKKISQGELSITSAALAQSLFQAEARAEKPFSNVKKLEFLHNLEGKSKRDVEREIAKINPEVKTSETVREISNSMTELKLVIRRELIEKLNKLKSIKSHTNPNLNYQELLGMLLELGLDKWDEQRKHEKRSLKQKNLSTQELPPPVAVKSRYIRAAVKSKIYVRDQGQCQFIDPMTQKKCCSSHLLQLDHIEPFALGGSNDGENLRLLCAAHNQILAESTYGRSYRTL